MFVFWPVMAALVVAELWVVADEARARFEWLVKPAAALTFIVAAWAHGALGSTWGTVMFVGFVLAAGGDVLLIPKDRRIFLAGLISFLLGHVGYAVAFAVRGLDWLWVGVAAAILLGVAAPILRWLWPHVEKPMRGPVAAYVAVITAMVALAAGTYGAHGDLWILVGAFGFYLSDLAVARERFVQKAFLNRAWGLPLYFGSQLLLATTVGS